MKNIILTCAVFILTGLTICAQSSSVETEKLKEINQKTVAKYKEGDFNEAIKSAQESIELTTKVFGAESSETAVAYTNIGEIYLAKKQYDKAAENLQKSLAIYQIDYQKNAEKLADNLERLALALTLDGKEKLGGETLLQALENAENAFGKDERQILPILKSLSDYYAYTRKKDEAEQIFIRRYLITAKYSQSGSEDLQKIEDDFYCFTYQNFNPSEASQRQSAFNKATLAGRTAKPEAKAEENIKTINGGVVNGKAKSLKIPNYPKSARTRKAQGVVAVKVLIDEQGNIIEAKAVCGDAELGAASVEAAKNVKFPPTSLDGKIVRVKGLLIYNFAR